jgi:HrpA-like RNA helicase
MADLGITDFEDFDFITAPEKEGLIGGIETLNLLEALDTDRSLSNIGKLMTEFPLAPRQSRIITEAILRYPDVIQETIIAAAFLSTQSPYILPPGEEVDARQAHHRFRDSNGDFVSYLKLFKAYNDSTSKIKFCEKNYLDERAMAEIVNVTVQLEEILASLKIPVHQRTQILSGNDIDDYLYCIGRGMIQFVCIREGKGKNSSYRSLTADKIIIHPGSVMFRVDPQFIVAGEIVRTSRMYAMSVSPISKEVLERINPKFITQRREYTEDIRKFSRSSGTKTFNVGQRGIESQRNEDRSRQKTRDFTNNIKIAGEIFEITTVKGKKTVLLPWEKLSRIGENAAETIYKGLKGKIIVKNQYNLLAGEKLELILSIAPTLDVEGAFLDVSRTNVPGTNAPEASAPRGRKTWPRKENFNVQENLGMLLDHLDDLVRPVIWKKDSKDLGFLGLFTDHAGNYWFRASRGFHTSLNESLSSLDTLISELGEDIAVEHKHIVNQCYRRLSDYLF